MWGAAEDDLARQGSTADCDTPRTPTSPVTPPPWRRASAGPLSPVAALDRRVSLDSIRASGDLKRVLFASSAGALPIRVNAPMRSVGSRRRAQTLHLA